MNYLDNEVIIRSSLVLVDKEEMNLVNHAKPVHLATQVIIDSGYLITMDGVAWMQCTM